MTFVTYVCMCLTSAGNKEDLISRLRKYYLDQVGALYLELRASDVRVSCYIDVESEGRSRGRREGERGGSHGGGGGGGWEGGGERRRGCE